MKKNVFAICDEEKAYACHLAEYVNEKKLTPFEAQAFTSVTSLLSYAADHEIGILLISAHLVTGEIRALPVGRLILLSEGECVSEEEEPCIFKYQPTESLIREMMEFYISENPQPELVCAGTKKTALFGIFSPLGRTRATSFALTLGEVLAEKGKVLYLNFEEFSGFADLFHETPPSDMTDLIYFLRRRDDGLLYRLNSVICTFRNLEYIPPALSPMDLKEVSGEEWIAFLQEVIAFREYDAILLDLSWQIDGLFSILKSCERIYMPVQDDLISEAKLKQFGHLLELSGMEAVQQKLVRIHPPLQPLQKEGGDLIGQLLWGEMGSYVRRLLEKESE